MADAKRQRPPKQPDSIIPSIEMVIVVYVVLALFGAYVLYMYYPITVRRLFNWLFGGFV